MSKLSILGLLCIVLCGCSTFQIHKKLTKMEGVPFYNKIGMVKQTTIYTRSWIEVSIDYKLLKNGKPTPHGARSATIPISIATYDEVDLLTSFASAEKGAAIGGFVESLNILMSALEKSCNEDSKKNCIISLSNLNRDANIETVRPNHLYQVLESNSSRYEAIVDYDNVYYFNTQIPIFGTASGNIELSSDGTLLKATSTADNNKLADLIPFKELFIDKWGLDKTTTTDTNAPEGIAEEPKNYLLTINVGSNGYKYELTKYYKSQKNEDEEDNFVFNAVKLTFGGTDLSMKRTKFAESKAEPKIKKKNVISFEGGVTLPEEK